MEKSKHGYGYDHAPDPPEIIEACLNCKRAVCTNPTNCNILAEIEKKLKGENKWKRPRCLATRF